MNSTNPNPNDSPLKKRLTSLTTPSLLFGIVIGIILSILAYFTLRIIDFKYVIIVMLPILIIILLVVLIGYHLFESKKKQLRKEFNDALKQSKIALITILQRFPDYLDYLTRSDKEKAHQALEEIRRQLPKVQPVVSNTLNMIPLFITRMLTMSSLIAVLGVSVSFAIFLVTYMQVERLSKQNEIQMMALATDFNKEFKTTAYKKIEDAIVDCKCLYDEYGGKFSYQDINAYLGFLDTIGYYNKKGLLDKEIIDELFGGYIIEAYVYEEIEKYIRQIQDPQQGGQETALIYFQHIAKELLKYPHRVKHAELYKKDRYGKDGCLSQCPKFSDKKKGAISSLIPWQS